MDFLDDISPVTKRYVAFVALLCVGILAFDCMAGGDGSSAPERGTRSVRGPQ